MNIFIRSSYSFFLSFKSEKKGLKIFSEIERGGRKIRFTLLGGGGHSEFGNNKITNCGVAVPLVIGVRKMFFNHFKSRQTV